MRVFYAVQVNGVDYHNDLSCILFTRFPPTCETNSVPSGFGPCGLRRLEMAMV